MSLNPCLEASPIRDNSMSLIGYVNDDSILPPYSLPDKFQNTIM